MLAHRRLEHGEDEGEGEEHLDEEVAAVEREGRVSQEVGRHEGLGQEGAAEAADHLWYGVVVWCGEGGGGGERQARGWKEDGPGR